MIRKESIIDFIFIRYFFIVYYLYMMSVNVILSKDGIWGILVNGLMFLFLIYASFVRNRYNKKFSCVYLYIIFIFIQIVLQSSDFQYSMKNFLKYIIGLLCLPIGFNVLSSVKKMRKFQMTGILFLLLYLVNIVLANIFHFGDYYGYMVEGGLEIGNVFADGLYANVYVITSIFFTLLLFSQKKGLILLLAAICGILVFVNMKRTTILQLIVGLVIYQVFYYICNSTNKLKFGLVQLKYIGLFLLFALMALPVFYGEIQMRYENREKTFENAANDMTSETRILEFIAVSDEILHSDNILTFLFGKETFNIVGTYGHGRFGDRQMHMDYSILLHGTGVVGCLVWFGIHLYLILWIIKMRKSTCCKYGIISSILYPLFFSLILLYFISMGSGTFNQVISSSFLYASLGGILRYIFNRWQFISYRKTGL